MSIFSTALSFISPVGGLFVSLFSSPMNLIYLAAALAVGYVAFTIHNDQSKIAALQLANNNLQVQVTQLQTSAEVQAANDKVNTDLLIKQAIDAKNLDGTITNIGKTPASDDGPVAKVLQKELER